MVGNNRSFVKDVAVKLSRSTVLFMHKSISRTRKGKYLQRYFKTPLYNCSDYPLTFFKQILNFQHFSRKINL